MMNNKKATMLVELSVFIICSMIFFVAVSDLISSRNYMVRRLVENNSVMMILDSIAAKIRYDIKSGIKPDELDLSQYDNMIKSESYKLKIRKDDSKFDILLGVYYDSKFGSVAIPEVKRVYKKEVSFYEE